MSYPQTIIIPVDIANSGGDSLGIERYALTLHPLAHRIDVSSGLRSGTLAMYGARLVKRLKHSFVFLVSNATLRGASLGRLAVSSNEGCTCEAADLH